MRPLVSPHRAELPGGLWTPKLGGELKEGDPLCGFTVTGRGKEGNLGTLFMNRIELY